MRAHHILNNFLLAFTDGLLICTCVLLGGVLRFAGEISQLAYVEALTSKILVILSVTQFTFYYFDLYERRVFRERISMTIALLKALAVSSALLAILYYPFPSLAMGRGALALGLGMVFFSALSWRLLYVWLLKTPGLKERILIIGTGEMARRMAKEIYENGQDSFEIVGFIHERADHAGGSL